MRRATGAGMRESSAQAALVASRREISYLVILCAKQKRECLSKLHLLCADGMAQAIVLGTMLGVRATQGLTASVLGQRFWPRAAAPAPPPGA